MLIPKLLGVGNSALIVTGVMLPVGGAITRTVALSQLADSMRLAVTLPGAELAATGLMPITFVVAGWLVARLIRDQVRGTPGRVVWILFAIVAPLLLLFAAPGTQVVENVVIFGIVVTSLWIVVREETPEPIRGGRLALFLLVMYASASVAYGLSGRVGPSVEVSSSAPNVLPPGPYIRVAEDADWIFLAPCADHGTVIQAHKDTITAIISVQSDVQVAVTGDFYSRCP